MHRKSPVRVTLTMETVNPGDRGDPCERSWANSDGVYCVLNRCNEETRTVS